MTRSRRKRWFLREWRKHRGLTQEQLASKLNTTKSRISELETGSERYNQDILEALADALETQPGYLLSINPIEPMPDDAVKQLLAKIPADQLPQIEAILATFIKRP